VSAARLPAVRPDFDPHCHPERGCVTCGDVAVPVKVLAIDEDRQLGLCEDERGRRESVEIALVQPVSVGDELLVHAGTAIATLEQGAGRDRDTPGRIRASSDHRSPSAPWEEVAR
jgi:hydrogenase assembly chaperone HypC/HupF